MDERQHHKELVNGLYKEQEEIFDSSEQAIYAYLDDNHKVCNKKFAALLGYKSPDEWSKTGENVLGTFVAPKSQEVLSKTYHRAMEERVGSTIGVTWKKESGGTVDTTVILVPIAYKGHLFALHFVS